MARFWRSRNSRRSAKQRRRAIEPRVDLLEGRALTSDLGGFRVSGAAAQTRSIRATRPSMSDTVEVYRVLEATITRGPDAGATFRGPLLMVQTSRVQLYGYLYAGTGQPILVVGTIRGQRLDLRLFIARSGGAQSLVLIGKGALVPVVGGWPGAESLIGSGTLSGPRQGDVGLWTTTEPSADPGRSRLES